MKNKIISIIFIILFITSCHKSRDITGGGNNGGGNSGNIRLTKENFELPQTNTDNAKKFLEKFQEMKQKYPKAELMLYYRRVNYTINSGYKKYYFDNNANITNIHINGYDNKATNCEFWGMLPDNTQIACYYYKKSDGTYVVLNSLMYENELIKDKVSIFNKNGISRNEDLALKTSAAVLKSETNAYYDKKNINQSQVNTKEANDWKKEVKNKTYIGFFQEKYIFDNDGNITNDNDRNFILNNKKYTFWGAVNDGRLYGLYYNYPDVFGQYDNKVLYIETNKNIVGMDGYAVVYSYTTNIRVGSSSKADKLMFKEATGYSHNYKTLNNSTTTAENYSWKKKVAGKIIEEKEVENTYTFLDNGDISVKTSKGKDYTLKFWGAESPVDGIYYVKVNLQDIFGNIAPNEETYFYYGYRFEEYSYRLSELREFWQHPFHYCNIFTNWYEKNFDKKGKSRGKIDWANMPLQTTKNIAFWNTQENILLMEKQK